MKRKTLINRIVVAIVMGSFLTVTTACYGPFNLTKNVYHWNSNIKGSSEVNEKWMKEFVFFGMIIIPVYMFSASARRVYLQLYSVLEREQSRQGQRCGRRRSDPYRSAGRDHCDDGRE